MRRSRLSDVVSGKLNRWVEPALLTFWLLLAIVPWSFFFLHRVKGSQVAIEILLALTAGWGVFLLLIWVGMRVPFARLSLWLATEIAGLIGGFGQLYWNEGTRANFSQPLSRLDAIYFAVGTLSTAGTGNLNAISESARGTQLSEMLAAMTVILFGVGVVLAWVVSSRD